MKIIRKTLAVALLLGAASAAQADTIVIKGPPTAPGTELSITEPCKDFANYFDAECYYEKPNYLVLQEIPGQPGEYYVVSSLSSHPYPNFTPAAEPPAVPLPPSVWLFGSALLGLISIARHRRQPVIVVDAPAQA